MGVWPENCFKGKQILITGGTSGIGAAIAMAFAEEGASVLVTGATAEEVAHAPCRDAIDHGGDTRCS